MLRGLVLFIGALMPHPYIVSFWYSAFTGGSIVGWGDSMPIPGTTTVTPELLGSTIEDRIEMCLKLSAEAELRASEVGNPETARFYRDQKRQWDELAAELRETAAARVPSR